MFGHFNILNSFVTLLTFKFLIHFKNVDLYMAAGLYDENADLHMDHSHIRSLCKLFSRNYKSKFLLLVTTTSPAGGGTSNERGRVTERETQR